MAELATVGLASNIISFIDFSIEFSQLVREVVQAHGQLPKELEECREYVETISTWLANIKRTATARATAEKEDRHLEAAIQQCMKPSSDLIYLLSSLCENTDCDPDISIARIRKIRDTLKSVKRAVKIVWKKDQIKDIRDKLRESRDNVCAHIASRTGMQVGKIREEQKNVIETVQGISGNFHHAVIRLENLEAQNQYLIMQNHQLNEKVNILCDVLSGMQKDHRNRFAEIFDYVPPKATISHVVNHLRFIASRLIESGPSLSFRISRMKSRPTKYQLANVPTATKSHLTVQVIVKDGSMLLGQERPKLLLMTPEDAQNDFSLTKALHREAAETFYALKATTRVTFVRFHHKDGQLSVLRLRELEVFSDLPATPGYIRPIIATQLSQEIDDKDSNLRLIKLLRECRELERSLSDDIQHSGDDWNRAINQLERISSLHQQAQISKSHTTQVVIKIPPLFKRSILSKTKKTPSPMRSMYGELEKVKREEANRVSKDRPEESPEGEWGIFIERDWSAPAKTFFWLYTIAGGCRGISYGLLYFGLLGSSSSALQFSLLWTIVVGAIVLLYFLDVHTRFLADPKGTFRAIYLASNEALHDRGMRMVIAMVFCVILPIISIAVGVDRRITIKAFLVLMLLMILLWLEYIMSFPREFWNKRSPDGHRLCILLIIFILTPTRGHRLCILVIVSIPTSIYFSALATKELFYMYPTFGSLFGALVFAVCGLHFVVLNVNHWVAESWQLAFLFLMLKVIFNGDFSNQWKPYMGTLTASTYTVILMHKWAPSFVEDFKYS